MNDQLFGHELQRFELANGLRVLLLRDPSAPVISFQTWFGVGSRDEYAGKSGQAHLLEHLMFLRTESLQPGDYDQILESLGAENNASTWFDFTQYMINAPSEALEDIIKLEAERMHLLQIEAEEFQAERDVVLNERKLRVDEDPEGLMSERLWELAYPEHGYGWPTIGSQADIEAFTPEICLDFYKTWYCPANADLIIVGDFEEIKTIQLLEDHYGSISRSPQPVRATLGNSSLDREIEESMSVDTELARVVVAFPAPPLAEHEHLVLSLLCDLLTGTKSSRLRDMLVNHGDNTSDVRCSLSPLHYGGLIEIWASGRTGITAEALQSSLLQGLSECLKMDINKNDLSGLIARQQLGFYSGLESAEGKASLLGFNLCVEQDYRAGLERIEALEKLTIHDVKKVASRLLNDTRRIILRGIPTSTVTPGAS